MSWATATRWRVERLQTKSEKVFYWLLISDWAASWDLQKKNIHGRNFKLSVDFFLKIRSRNFSSREFAAHPVI